MNDIKLEKFTQMAQSGKKSWVRGVRHTHKGLNSSGQFGSSVVSLALFHMDQLTEDQVFDKCCDGR